MYETQLVIVNESEVITYSMKIAFVYWFSNAFNRYLFLNLNRAIWYSRKPSRVLES